MSVCLQCRRPGFDPPVGEDPLEKEITAHSSTLAWKIPRTEEPGRLQSMGSQRVTQTEQLHFYYVPGYPFKRWPFNRF